ncbi:MAG TPA: hypothetical protein VLH12_03630 [Usitatibacter sp.]|nr:hypothetical protein [Usitatibacter sp.]
MSAVTWQQLLANAITPGEIITIARDFIANVDHVELARLPPECRPGKMFESLDVHSYAYDLVRHLCAKHDEGAGTVQQLLVFFSQAAIRLSQIEGPSDPGSATRARLFG